MVNFLVFIHLSNRLGLSKAVRFNFLSESETMAWAEA